MNSWNSKLEEISNQIETVIRRKENDRIERWKKNLLLFYHQTRKKLMRLALGITFIYLTIFYTPLVWFFASPLKVSEAPQQADAIVVFAGGVGESGKAKEGYEERVQQAVELYKKGYAKEMIFSSGYMYVFKEPQVMKLLAVSLGVPEGAIILEDKATNTYQNVRLTSKILEEKHYTKILLVTSPYNTLRASLVFRKYAPGIKVIYTPIPKSRFYEHGYDFKGRRVLKQINIKQIRGIVHEYLGILYYRLKGYI
jgi:uncharacterized SAM-binding protein YcdF (DUF218 family)